LADAEFLGRTNGNGHTGSDGLGGFPTIVPVEAPE
jgi:hypothetical protein